jgi:tRNA (cytidine/uridine-2'-O-)-methyltransferase
MIGIETGGSNNIFNKNFLFNDVFVFGSESSGLPQYVMDDLEILSIPMCKGSRSLNLANCASIVLYEAWRQFDFIGSVDLGNMGYNFANGL